jgi:hypothetical protein
VKRFAGGVSFQVGLNSLLGHEVIERFDRPPPPGIDPHRRDPQAGGKFDLVHGFLNICPPKVGVGRDEPLMRREPHQGQAQRMSLRFELVDGRGRLVLHLNMKDLDPIKPHRRRFLDASRHPQPLAPELPERVSRNADRVTPTNRLDLSRAGVS